MTDVASDADQIRLSLPARHEYARIARIAVTALALRLGFTYREVEQIALRLLEEHRPGRNGSPATRRRPDRA